MKPILKKIVASYVVLEILVLCVVGAATLMSGCVEPSEQKGSSLRGVYESVMLNAPDVRESDGFGMEYKIFNDEHYWKVTTLTTYPAFENMRDDEPHRLIMSIKHRYSVRESHDKMVELSTKAEESARSPDTFAEMSYGDMSYMTTSVYDMDEAHNKAVCIRIQKDKMIGELRVFGYSDMEECQEVADHYAPMLGRIMSDVADIEEMG